jgi:hypothetical protein
MKMIERGDLESDPGTSSSNHLYLLSTYLLRSTCAVRRLRRVPAPSSRANK